MVEVFGNIFLSSPESFLHLKGCTALQPDTGGWPLGMNSLFKKKEKAYTDSLVAHAEPFKG